MINWNTNMQEAPRDKTEILLYSINHGTIQGWFCPGEWSDETTESPREYSGAVWVLGDDLYQVEVEEYPDNEFHDGEIVAWSSLPDGPPKGSY